MEKNITEEIGGGKGKVPLQYIFIVFLLFSFLWFSPIMMVDMGIFRYIIFLFAVLPTIMMLSHSFFKNDYFFDLFNPLNFAALSVMVGTTLRCHFLLTTNPMGERQSFLLFGEAPTFLIFPAIIIFIGFCFFVLGYSMKTRRLSLETFSILFQRYQWDNSRFWILATVLIIGGTTGMYLFFKQFGLEELALETFSDKRVEYLDEGGFVKASHSYLRWLASLIKVAYYLVLVKFALSQKSFFSFLGLLVFFLAIGAILFPIMTSTRSFVIYVIFNTMLIWYYIRGLPVLLFAISIPLGFIMVYLMLLFRQGAVTSQGINADVSSGAAYESIVGSGNMMGIAKTGHIVSAVPTKLDYAFGGSMISWVFAPIPRSMWHEKPYMVPGAIIRQKVYLNEGADHLGGGNPPGIIAEMFWNFGWIGLTLGMFLSGRLLKFFYVSFRPFLYRNPNAILLYSAMILPVSFVFVGSSFNQALLQSLLNVIPIYISLLIVTKH